jgi:hypothetical protein
MRSARFAFIFCLFLCALPIYGQQAQPSAAPPPATKDPQAVSVVNQALKVAGGASAISAIKDYTGTGSITYHMAQDIQGTVTIRGRRLSRLRIDASLRATAATIKRSSTAWDVRVVKFSSATPTVRLLLVRHTILMGGSTVSIVHTGQVHLPPMVRNITPMMASTGKLMSRAQMAAICTHITVPM